MRWTPDQVAYALRVKETYLREMSVAEGIAEYLSLMAEFGPMLEQTEEIYRQQRLQDLRNLQDRLHRAGLRGTSS